VFLGLEGIVIKSHGGTDEVGYAGAIEIGYGMVRHDLLSRIREQLSAWQDSRQDSRNVLAAAAVASRSET
jgi:glycerol-3-phosphate acyltransferase PlsX